MKVKESITNQSRISRMQHELGTNYNVTEIRDDTPRFARFSLTIVIKKAHKCFRATVPK